MNAAEYAKRYTEAQVTMVDRGRLLLLVFEGGLRFLRLTREALQAGDLPRMANHLELAQANASRSLRHVDEVLAVFGTITDAYRTILENRPGTEPETASAA